MKIKAEAILVVTLLMVLSTASAFSLPSFNETAGHSTGKPKTILPGHSNEVRSVVFSPDGKMLASGSMDGTVKLWDAATGEPLRTITGHEGEPYNALAFSPDGKILAVTSAEEMVKLYDASSDKLLRTLAQCHILGSAAFSADGMLLVTGSGNTVRLWNPQTGTITRTLMGHSKEVTGLAFSADGKIIVSAGEDDALKIWEAQTGKLLRTLPVEPSIRRLAVSPDGKTVAVAGFNVISFWNAQTGKLNLNVKASENTFPEGPSIYSMSFSPDGKTLAVAAYDVHLSLIDTQTGKQKYNFEARPSHTSSVAFSPDGKMVVCGGDLKTIKVWSLETTELKYKIGLEVYVRAAAFSPNGKLIANDCGIFFDVVNLRDAQTGKLIRTLGGHHSGYDSGFDQLIFSPDGEILCGTEGRAIYLWDVETGELRHKLEEEADSVSFSPDSKTLATNGNYKTGMLKLWDVETGKLKRRILASKVIREKEFLSNKFVLFRLGVLDSHISADGDTIAGLVDDGLTLKIWHTRTGALLRQVSLPSKRREFGVFSPDGKMLVDNNLNVRDVGTGKIRCSLAGENFRIAFSPDGNLIASATEDDLIKLWDAKTGKLIKTLKGHTNDVSTIAFSPDGKTLLSGSDDGTVKLWDTQSGEVKLTVVIPEDEAKVNQ